MTRHQTTLLPDGLSLIGFSECTQPSLSVLCAKIDMYIHELELFNSTYDLVGNADHDEIIIRHIFDSLAPYVLLQETITTVQTKTHSLEQNTTFTIADVGSGAGLPGIPLALAFPDINFVLIERMSKRCAFLENCSALLGLKNITIENIELEKTDAERFDLAVFRAFRPLDAAMIKSLLRIIRQNGVLAAYKGKKTKIDEEMAPIISFAPRWTAHALCVPYLEVDERHIVIIEK